MKEWTGSLIPLPSGMPWSMWSEFGLLLGLPRLPEEDNIEYRDRLLDVYRRRGSSKYLGLIYALHRELGLEFKDDAITIRNVTDDSGYDVVEEVYVSVIPEKVVITSSNLQVNGEVHTVPSDTLTITTDHTIYGPVYIYDEDGNRLYGNQFRINYFRDQIEFIDEFAGSQITLNYTYALTADLTGDLDNLVGRINSLTTIENIAVVTGEVTTGYGSWEASNLQLMEPTSINGRKLDTEEHQYYNAVRVGCGQARIRAINDPWVVESLLGTDREFFGTPLMELVKATEGLAHIEWENTIFDHDRWNDKMGVAEIPTLFDAKSAWYVCSNPSHTDTYNSSAFADLSGECPIDHLDLVPVGYLYSETMGGNDSISMRMVLDSYIIDTGITSELDPDYNSFCLSILYEPTGDLALEIFEEGF